MTVQIKERNTRGKPSMINVSEHSGYYTACQSHLPLRLPSFFTPVVHPWWASQRNWTIFDPLTLWLFLDLFFSLLYSEQVQMSNAQNRLLYMKGRKCQHRKSPATDARACTLKIEMTRLRSEVHFQIYRFLLRCIHLRYFHMNLLNDALTVKLRPLHNRGGLCLLRVIWCCHCAIGVLF